jgi:serine/alanine adding enzyme
MFMNPDYISTTSFFQTQECLEFYNELPFLEGFRFTVEDDEGVKGSVIGYLISEGKGLKSRLTKRAIISGGAMLHKNISRKQIGELLQKTRNELRRKGAIYVEFRNNNDYSEYKSFFEESGFVYQPHLNFQIHIDNSSTAFKQLAASKRRYVRLAIKSGVNATLTQKPEDVLGFYELLKSLYTHKVKLPLFPEDFFILLVQKEFAKLVVVKFKDEIIGGSLCVSDKDKLYQWFVCGEDKKFKNAYPSTFANWATIEYAASNNYSMVDMMGAGKPDKDYGVRAFKAGFGGTLVEHGRFVHVARPLLFFIGKTAVRLMKKI